MSDERYIDEELEDDIKSGISAGKNVYDKINEFQGHSPINKNNNPENSHGFQQDDKLSNKSNYQNQSEKAVNDNLNKNGNGLDVNKVNSVSIGEAPKEVAKEVTEEVTKEAVKDATGKAAASAAAAASTGGISLAVQLLIKGMKLADQQWQDVQNGVQDVGKSAGVFTFVAVFLILIIIICTAIFTPVIALYDKTTAIKEWFSNTAEYLEDPIKAEYFKTVFGESYSEVSNTIAEANRIDANNVEYYKTVINTALENAITVYGKDYATNFDKIKLMVEEFLNINIFKKSDSYNQYRSARWPYSVDEYTIGDVIDLISQYDEPGSYSKEPDYLALFTDVNYAEIISVICQSDNYTEGVSYSDFYDIMVSENTARVLLEFSYDEPIIEQNEVKKGSSSTPSSDSLSFDIEPSAVNISFITSKTDNKQKPYEGTIDVTENKSGISEEKLQQIQSILENNKVNNSTNNAVNNNTTLPQQESEEEEEEESEIEVSGTSTCSVYPYGLEELYYIIGVNPVGLSSVSPEMSNYEMLDYHEDWLRLRLPDCDLGPSFKEERNRNSSVYEIISSYIQTGDGEQISNTYSYQAPSYPTGRSLFRYTDNSITISDKVYADTAWREYTAPQFNFVPNGQSVILDMPQYINQGEYRNYIRGTDGKGDSIAKSGCCDCSYAMSVSYYTRNMANIVDVSKKYVIANQFQGKAYMSRYNVTEERLAGGFDINYCISSLTEGKPIVLQIKGIWKYNGVEYHSTSGGHFLVIIGYDDCGFYVLDPGKRANNDRVIPYLAFNYIDIPSYRIISGSDVYYRTNTLQ